MPALTVLLLLLAQSDSADLLAHARRAQADFERARLFLAPPGDARGGDRCDLRIGRFCYWNSGRDTPPREEPEQVGAARDRLLATLDSAARALPGDAWVAAQRVHYLVEAGHPRAAVAAAEACRAPAWWCAALEGLAWHRAGETERADAAFGTALALMPEEERCRWTDLSDLLSEPLRGRYRRLSCGVRARFNARLWWLAQPLWSNPGNDRRTEHYARVTLAALVAQARSPYGFWGDDQRELVVRYGWPVAWERDDGGGMREALPIGHEPEPSFHFVPDAEEFDSLAYGDGPPPFDSSLARERYAPSYARAFTRLEPGFATFRRGESTLVVASYDVSDDTLYRYAARRAALVLARDESTAVIARRDDAALAGALVAAAPWQPAVLALELRALESSAAARVRQRAPVVEPALGRIAVSGILLFDPTDSLPTDLPAALERIHVGGVHRGDRVGLYWETYGLAPGEAVGTTVTVTPEHRGWLRRLAAGLHLAARARDIRLEWRESARPEQGRAARALLLDLGGLAPGRYRVSVALETAGRGVATTSRVIEVSAR